MDTEALQKQEERQRLQERITEGLDLPLSVLAFVMLGLLLIELTMDLSSAMGNRVSQAQTAIWAVFVVAFLVEFTVAPNKWRYLRKNWLTVISVALPAFRAVRILRVARALRGLSLVRILTTLNRGARALGGIVRQGQLGYVLILTTLVALTTAAAVFYFERGQPNASINSVGDALWWSFTTVTTINVGLEATTLEGRVVALLLRFYALAVSGYLTAVIAVYFLGWKAPSQPEAASSGEIRALRHEIACLRLLLQHQSRGIADEPGRTD